MSKKTRHTAQKKSSFKPFLAFSILLVIALTVVSLLLLREVKKTQSSVKETKSDLVAKINSAKQEMAQSLQQTNLIIKNLCEAHNRQTNNVTRMIKLLFDLAWQDDPVTGKILVNQYLKTGNQEIWNKTIKMISKEELERKIFIAQKRAEEDFLKEFFGLKEKINS